jgi:hypothetical protein
VLDNTYAAVYVFSFDREYLGELNSFRGDLVVPAAMGVRPGLYAPLSSVLPPIEDPVAGESINTPMYVRARASERNEPAQKRWGAPGGARRRRLG